MRILVTGASGFIGRHCIPYLVEGRHEVHAVARSPLPISGATWHAADLLSPGTPSRLIAAIRPDAVLHLAWYTTPVEYWNSSENLRWVQVTAEMLHAISVTKCRRVVMAGTSAEYDHSSGVCSETITPLRPASLYATSKHSVYSLLEKFAPLSGISWCWGRVFNVYGPHEDSRRLVPSIVRTLLTETGNFISVVGERRDFLHVEDVAHAFAMIVESDFSGSVNIGSGSAVMIKEIAEKIASVVGKPLHIRLDGTVPIFPMIQAQTDILREKIGWKPGYSLQAGLTHTVAWWQGRLLRD